MTNPIQAALAAKKAAEASTEEVLEGATIATLEEVKVASAMDTIKAEVLKAPAGSYTILKRNLFINATGTHIKCVHDYLVPADAGEKALCEEFVRTGHLAANK